MTVQDIWNWINARAPFDTQEAYDNAGLLLGDGAWEVTGVHVALDVTDGVISEAEKAGANLIVTHHPLMFAPRKRMTESDYEGRLICRMIRGHMALIAAHTNLDRALGGMNDVLSKLCGMRDVTGEGFVRVGNLPDGMTAGALIAQVAQRLNTTVRVMGQMPENSPVHRMAVCSGGGSDEWETARSLGAEVFLSGEIKHHHALAMCAEGMIALECGHFATEEPGIFALADALQNHLNAVQYKGCVTKSAQGGYAGRYPVHSVEVFSR